MLPQMALIRIHLTEVCKYLMIFVTIIRKIKPYVSHHFLYDFLQFIQIFSCSLAVYFNDYIFCDQKKIYSQSSKIHKKKTINDMDVRFHCPVRISILAKIILYLLQKNASTYIGFSSAEKISSSLTYRQSAQPSMNVSEAKHYFAEYDKLYSEMQTAHTSFFLMIANPLPCWICTH